MKTIKTKSGDTFDLIAFREFGNCKYTANLMNVNRAELNYCIFPAGIELKLPEIKSESTVLKLPAWRM